MYWEGKVRAFSSLKSSLKDSRLPLLVIILIALFCILKMSLQIGELPQNKIPYLNTGIKEF